MRSRMLAAAVPLLLVCASAAASTPERSPKAIAHGHYLVRIGGCEDCHTPGYAGDDTKIPKDKLLTGDGFVWHGPWGTTYPINLRLFVQGLTVQQWIHTVRTTKARPPMPWWSFRYMSDYDLASIYYYIRSLGPAGKPAPAYLPPGRMPAPPHMDFVLPPTPPGAKAGPGQRRD